MDLNSYVVALVVIACFCVGYIIKNMIPNKNINKYIPLIMGVLGVILNTWLNLWITPDVLVEASERTSQHWGV